MKDYMKSACIVLFAVFTLGCASEQHSHTTLTKTEATQLAVRLANDKASRLCWCRPFREDHTTSMDFIAGHWYWCGWMGFRRVGPGVVCDVQSQVTLSPDGATNNVEIQLFDYRDLYDHLIAEH
jgi:hypothetical protein